VRLIQYKIHPSQLISLQCVNSIGKTPEHFYSLYYPQRKNPAKAFDNLFIMEEAVAGTTGDAPESVINIDDIDIDVDNLVDIVDPIGAAFDPRTPNAEVPTSITCNPNRSPRDKSIKDMKNKEDAFEKGYDSDGELGPFNNRIDKEGQQVFNEDDDDGVGFVAERAIDDERGVDTNAGDMDDTDVAIHVPILLDEINIMYMVQLRNELKLRQQAVAGRKFELRDQLIEALEKKLPKYTVESLAKKKDAATEAKKKNTTQGLFSFSKNAFWKELKPNLAVV
jgi:hypothetical protein